MFKILFALTLLSGSINLFAQDTSDTTMENRVTGTYPEGRETLMRQQKWRAGITTGVNSPKGDVTSTTEYGITTAFQPMALEHYGFGLDVGTSKLDTPDREQRTIVMVNALYNVGGDIPVLSTSYIGIGGGPIISNKKIKWGYAPVGGFDVPLTTSGKEHEFLSLGLTAKYLINPNTPDSLSAAAALKYWF